MQIVTPRALLAWYQAMAMAMPTQHYSTRKRADFPLIFPQERVVSAIFSIGPGRAGPTYCVIPIISFSVGCNCGSSTSDSKLLRASFTRSCPFVTDIQSATSGSSTNAAARGTLIKGGLIQLKTAIDTAARVAAPRSGESQHTDQAGRFRPSQP